MKLWQQLEDMKFPQVCSIPVPCPQISLPLLATICESWEAIDSQHHVGPGCHSGQCLTPIDEAMQTWQARNGCTSLAPDHD